MATYGLLPPTAGVGASGIVQFTGWTPTLGSNDAVTPSTTGYVYRNGIQQGDDRIAKMFRNAGFTAFTTELLFNLIGAAPGVNTTKQQFRSIGGYDNTHGLIKIEANPQGNRVTTASDVTAFKALLRRSVFPTNYAVDVSGNGGGGKAGR